MVSVLSVSGDSSTDILIGDLYVTHVDLSSFDWDNDVCIDDMVVVGMGGYLSWFLDHGLSWDYDLLGYLNIDVVWHQNLVLLLDNLVIFDLSSLDLLNIDWSLDFVLDNNLNVVVNRDWFFNDNLADDVFLDDVLVLLGVEVRDLDIDDDILGDWNVLDDLALDWYVFDNLDDIDSIGCNTGSLGLNFVETDVPINILGHVNNSLFFDDHLLVDWVFDMMLDNVVNIDWVFDDFVVYVLFDDFPLDFDGDRFLDDVIHVDWDVNDMLDLSLHNMLNWYVDNVLDDVVVVDWSVDVFVDNMLHNSFFLDLIYFVVGSLDKLFNNIIPIDWYIHFYPSLADSNLSWELLTSVIVVKVVHVDFLDLVVVDHIFMNFFDSSLVDSLVRHINIFYPLNWYLMNLLDWDLYNSLVRNLDGLLNLPVDDFFYLNLLFDNSLDRFFDDNIIRDLLDPLNWDSSLDDLLHNLINVSIDSDNLFLLF